MTFDLAVILGCDIKSTGSKRKNRLIGLRNFLFKLCASKDTIGREKRQSTEWKKIFAYKHKKKSCTI